MREGRLRLSAHRDDGLEGFERRATFGGVDGDDGRVTVHGQLATIVALRRSASTRGSTSSSGSRTNAPMPAAAAAPSWFPASSVAAREGDAESVRAPRVRRVAHLAENVGPVYGS